MHVELLLITLIPIFLYALAEYKFGKKVGLISAIAMTGLIALWYFIRFDDFDPLFLVDIIILTGMGGISLKLGDSRYFKMQPALMGVCIVCYLGLYEVLWGGFFDRLIPIVKEANPQALELIDFENLSFYILPAIGVHTLLMTYTGLKSSTKVWVLARLSIFPILFIAMRFAVK